VRLRCALVEIREMPQIYDKKAFEGGIEAFRKGVGIISKVTIKIDFEELKEAISQFSDDERETLFFELNPAWRKALQKMEQEAIEGDDEGKTLSLEDI